MISCSGNERLTSCPESRLKRGIAQLLSLHLVGDFAEQRPGGSHPQVGGNENFFQSIEQVLIYDLFAENQPIYSVDEFLPRSFQPQAKAPEKTPYREA
jgi:hypothetical protein